MSTSIATRPPQEKASLIRLAVHLQERDVPVERIARNTQMSEAEVEAILHDPAAALAEADRLQSRGLPTPPIVTRPAPLRAVGPVAAPAPPVGIEALLVRASQSTLKRTVNLATRLRADLADLERRLAEEDRAHRANAAAETARQAALEAVAAAELALRKAKEKARLTGATTRAKTAAPRSTSSSDGRAANAPKANLVRWHRAGKHDQPRTGCPLCEGAA